MDYSVFKFKLHFILFLTLSLIPINALISQDLDSIKNAKSFTLDACIEYALKNNPEIKNAYLNEDYTETVINSKLSDWYPQIDLSFNYQHNFLLPTSNFNGRISHIGSENTSGLLLGVTQNLFNRDVLLASQSADDVREVAKQNTESQKIDLIVSVSKAFYNIILQEQQIKAIEEDIIRNQQSAKDATYQYQSGIVDNTDYKRATIALNNSKSQKVFLEESLKAEMVYLMQLMGYSETEVIALSFDNNSMEEQINIDTTREINYSNRIEIQQLETQKKLEEDNKSYYKMSFLPELSLFGNYNLNYLNNDFSELYSVAYPNSYIGLRLSFPIFQGGKRFQQIKGSELLIEQIDNDIINLKQKINSQYEDALAIYKGNLNNYETLKENLTLAKEVYEVIRLQYRSGVKTFLDVITAESDLKTAQINYFNALYKVLSSKVDVERALGNINY